MARFCACVSQALTKMVGRFAYHPLCFDSLAVLINGVMSCHALFLFKVMIIIKFSYISSRNELADFLGIPTKKLTHILYKKRVDNCYSSFDITKKNGRTRHINAPVDDLKSIQKRLSEALWEHQYSMWQGREVIPNISHAFEKNKSIITNAMIHRNKRFVFNVDLQNFFDSFHFGRVRGYFVKNRHFQLPIEVATVIAQLSCYNGCLPQGAPSSPIITNLVCQILDFRVLRISKKYKLDYTRYADDLTFSTNDKSFLDMQIGFYADLANDIESAGFRINNNKTRLQYKDSKQEVTGLVVNKKLSVNRAYYRNTKAMAYNLYKHGSFTLDNAEGGINQLEGRFSFINQLDKYNNELDKTQKHNFRTLNGREKQYQKFLYYKLFYMNEQPLIITEGKTDIVYLKSALKHFYTEYPSLITKNQNGEYDFKISFLKRSKRLKYFFNIEQDGADTMKNIYNYFSSHDIASYPDYLSYFNIISGVRPNKPVIFIFDNELESEKPLKKFANHAKLNAETKKELAESLSVKLTTEGNLFLLTNKLVNNQKECEIEDMFDKSTLEYERNGKTFSRNKNFDSNKHYGKEIFSQYISSNYRNINFDRFRDMLNNLNRIIESYSPSDLNQEGEMCPKILVPIH